LTSLFGRIEVASCEKTEDFERFALHKRAKTERRGQTRKKKNHRQERKKKSKISVEKKFQITNKIP